MWIVDRHPEHSNVFIAGSFCGTGFKFALTVGKLVMHMMTNRDDHKNWPKLRDGHHFKYMHKFSLDLNRRKSKDSKND